MKIRLAVALVGLAALLLTGCREAEQTPTVAALVPSATLTPSPAAVPTSIQEGPSAMPTDVYGNPRVQTPAKEAPSWNEFMADAQGRIATQFGEGDFKNESVEIHYTDDGFSLISLQLSGNAGRIKIDPNDSNSHSYSEPDVYYTEDGGKPLEKAVKVGQDEGAIDYAADPQESASRSSVAHGLAVTLLNELLP